MFKIDEKTTLIGILLVANYHFFMPI